MAIAIKESTARLLYRDLTDRCSDEGRPGVLENCPNCGERHVLYYGPRMEEDEARKLFLETSPKACPGHIGWLCIDEAPPVSVETHRERVRNKIAELEKAAAREEALAQQAGGSSRDALLLSAAQTRGKIMELQKELRS